MKVKDYVDGSIMKMKDAKASLKVNGVDYYFSSESNRKTFQANQDKYSKPAADDFRFLMNQALAQYFVIQESLANDSTQGITDAAFVMTQLLDYAGQLKPGFSEADLKIYHASIAGARKAAVEIAALNEPALEEIRGVFQPLSETMLAYVKTFNKDSTEGTPLFLIYCPMARDNKGASWLQRSDKTANPYFGASMLECGTLQEKQLFKCIVITEEDVDPVVSVEYQGKTYYFCCQKCIKKFNADPEQYLKGQADSSDHKEHEHSK